MLHYSLLLAAAAAGAHAQSLVESIAKIPDLSNFTAFYQNNAAFAEAIFSNESNWPITVLVPNDKAFADYQAQYSISLTEVPAQTLLDLVQYHTLVSNLTSSNFTGNGLGLTTPTLLTSSQYNNRSAGEGLANKFGGTTRAAGQVVFIKTTAGVSEKRFLLSRQSSSQSSIRSGLSSTVNLYALDDSEGLWSGGRFHVIDGLLTPPGMCAETIRHAGLSSLDNALNRSSLWNALDGGKNLTCLGPNNNAFGAAGNPDSKLNETDLKGALLFHTLPEVAYSDYLVDGQEFKSLQNGTVKVKIEGSGADRTIWFNNAKVIDANVLTHNGLLHVLDSVMVPLEDMNATASATPSATASPTGATSAAASTGAATPMGNTGYNWGLWALAIGAILMAEGLGGGWLLMAR